MQDTIRIKGIVRLFDADTMELLLKTHNLMVEGGGILTANLLVGSSAYSEGITYCALGTGSTAPAITQFSLATETIRSRVTQKGTSGHTANIATFFSASDCGFAIKEAGLFGYTASVTPGSGLMFARALLNYDNSVSPRNLMVGWEIPIEAA